MAEQTISAPDQRRWICYTSRKEPVCVVPGPKQGRLASSTDPDTWATIAEAKDYFYQHKEVEGIGIVLTEDDHLFVLDADTVRNPATGEIVDEFVREILSRAETYTEISRSGYGLHIIGIRTTEAGPGHEYKLPPNELRRPDEDIRTGIAKLNPDGSPVYKEPELGCYTRKKFVYLTGACINGMTDFAECTDVLTMVQEHFGTAGKAEHAEALRSPGKAAAPADSMSEEQRAAELQQKLTRGLALDEDFAALWNGARPRGNESQDDAVLLGKLACYCDRDPEAMTEAFLSSPYCAQKDEAHRKKCRREDYLPRTIARVLEATDRGTVAEWEALTGRRFAAPEEAVAAVDCSAVPKSAAPKDSAAPIENLTKKALEDCSAVPKPAASGDSPAPALPLIKRFEERGVPEFPVHAFPPVLRDFAEQTARQLEVDVSMVATAMLAVISLCCAKKYEVQIRGPWRVPVNLYCLIVANSAERKSPVVKAVTDCVYGWMRERNAELQSEVEAYLGSIAILSSRLEASLRTTAKQNGKEAVSAESRRKEEEYVRMRDELATLRKHPVSYCCLCVDDITPEALVSTMVEQHERLGLFSTEGGAFDTFSGRYNGGQANTDLILKAWSGDSCTIHRIGREKETLESPALCVLLACQHSVLQEIMANRKFRDRGLTSRFLYCFPKPKTYDWDVSVPVAEETLQAWQALISRLLEQEIPETPAILTLEPDAVPEARDFYNEVAGKLRTEYAAIESWAGKYCDQTFRIAGLLTAVRGRGTVSAEDLRSAIAISRYYLETAFIAHNADNEDEDTVLADAKAIWRKLDRDGYTQRTLHRKLHGRFPRMDDMIPGLEELERRGYIRTERIAPSSRGRPTCVIFRNPDAG